jgi:PhzF family phenazine biosynthesis protein
MLDSMTDAPIVPDVTVVRYAAFTDTPGGGNPAGVVLDARGLSAEQMLAIAADVGYSETAFLTAERGDRAYEVRYFSPVAEVPFCGHATIATAVALADRDGPGRIVLHTRAGEVPVETDRDEAGPAKATLTSVAPSTEPVAAGYLAAVLAVLGWSQEDLDPALEPRVAYAGARHLVLAAATRERLAALDYDFGALRDLMLAEDLTTVDLVWREAPDRFHARNPFPVGGVVEDPATGAAAAAFGWYLAELGLVRAPAHVVVLQGEDMGRPSVLGIELRPGEPGVRVSGTAVTL